MSESGSGSHDPGLFLTKNEEHMPGFVKKLIGYRNNSIILKKKTEWNMTMSIFDFLLNENSLKL